MTVEEFFRKAADRHAHGWPEVFLNAVERPGSAPRDSDTLLSHIPLTLLPAHHARVNAKRNHQAVAKSAGGGTPTDSSGSDSKPRRKFNGDGRGTCRRRMDSSTTRRSYASTRHIQARIGLLDRSSAGNHKHWHQSKSRAKLNESYRTPASVALVRGCKTSRVLRFSSLASQWVLAQRPQTPCTRSH